MFHPVNARKHLLCIPEFIKVAEHDRPDSSLAILLMISSKLDLHQMVVIVNIDYETDSWHLIAMFTDQPNCLTYVNDTWDERIILVIGR